MIFSTLFMFSISIYYKQILLYNLCIRDPSLERRCSMTTSVLEKSLSYDDLIASLRLIDDDFMRIIFKNQDCIQLLLDIILGEHVEIIENDSQYDLKNLLGRSLTIDVLVKDNNVNVNINFTKNVSLSFTSFGCFVHLPLSLISCLLFYRTFL